MTTANKITIVRIFAVPFFIVELLYYMDTGREIHRWAAVLTFALAAICDGVDGFVARRFNQRSELGAILDPLADKLLLVSGILLLSLPNQQHLERIPLWFTAMIFGRDVLLTIGVVLVNYACGKVKVRPSIIGKVATVLQMVVVLWTLFKWSAAWQLVWMIGAGGATLISGLFYVLEGMRQLSASPSSGPDPGQSAGAAHRENP